MRSFWPLRANPYYPAQYPVRIHPALNSFADECFGTFAHLMAYVGALALLAIVGTCLWDQLPVEEAVEPAAKAGWNLATRSHPAFAVSQFDLTGKTETYDILRHPAGAARTSFAGRRRAKSRSRSSKSTGPAANSANRAPPSPK
jgi:hypothetical protein